MGEFKPVLPERPLFPGGNRQNRSAACEHSPIVMRGRTGDHAARKHLPETCRESAPPDREAGPSIELAIHGRRGGLSSDEDREGFGRMDKSRCGHWRLTAFSQQRLCDGLRGTETGAEDRNPPRRRGARACAGRFTPPIAGGVKSVFRVVAHCRNVETLSPDISPGGRKRAA